jgi:hypothetical protein
MNTFKKKSLYLAVAGVSALGAGSASAVTLNADGLGSVLLYPYYTVRETSPGNAYLSLLSVVNSTASAKAVKVRFLEGKNSREVLDFNLYLSAKDVWVAAVVPTAEGAAIVTPDNSCTDGQVSQDDSNPTPFVNYAYTGDADDPANDDLDRTREGYVEIIEMGTMYGYGEDLATHVNGVPRNCDYLRLVWGATNPLVEAGYWTVSLSGGLFGTMSLINVAEGLDFAYDATALAAFKAEDNAFANPGSILPNLNSGDAVSLVVQNDLPYGNAAAFVTDWTNPWHKPIDAVSAVLMHDNIYNEFVLDKGTASGTDWVVTMPTKWAYYSVGASSTQIKVNKLFQRNFASTGACDDITFIKYDREEKFVKQTSSFSPPPPTKTDSICWEANVISFNTSNVLGSKNVLNAATTFENGWATMSFYPLASNATAIPAISLVHRLGGGNTTRVNLLSGGTYYSPNATYYGLPVVGFAAVTFRNGDVGGSLSNYGGNFDHKATRNVMDYYMIGN